MADPIVTVAQQDFLDQDPPLRGQKYACVSFVSPEDVIKRKDVFEFSKFIEALAKDVDAMLTQLDDKYAGKDGGFVRDMVVGIRERHAYLTSCDALQNELTAFIAANADKLTQDFQKSEGFRTSVRGFKIRGVYDSLEEARARAEKIRSFDSKFNVYVSEVGCWCPWSPNPEEIADNEFAESHLNTLMKKYKSNEALKNDFYERRKQELIEHANEQVAELKLNVSQESGAVIDDPTTEAASDGDAQALESAVDAGLQGSDPWLARK